MRVLTAPQTQALSVRSLGFDAPRMDFSADQVLIAFVRRVAAFECPCSTQELTRTALKLLLPLLPEDGLRERIVAVVDGLLDYGDLIENLEDDCEDLRQLVGLAVPSVVCVSESRLLLLGLTVGETDPLPIEFRPFCSMHGFARSLDVDNTRVAMSKLYESGYLLITEEEWGSLPHIVNASSLIDKYRRLFRDDVVVGSLEGLEILLPDRKVTFWPDRWTDKKFPDGEFVARRSRRYGENAWCFVRISKGIPTGLVDLPTKEFRFRACDEAWHLQQAIDSVRGVAQRFRMTVENQQTTLFEFFSPVPQWAHRQWNAIGEQASTKGALFSYRFPASVVNSVKHFAESRMWLVCQ
jgi:hypothetical protein